MGNEDKLESHLLTNLWQIQRPVFHSFRANIRFHHIFVSAKKAAGAEAPAARKEPHDGYARTPCDDLTVWFIASDFAAVMNAR